MDKVLEELGKGFRRLIEKFIPGCAGFSFVRKAAFCAHSGLCKQNDNAADGRKDLQDGMDFLRNRLITLGNIGASLVFLKAYFETANLWLLANSIVFLCMFYFLGARLIYVSTRLKS